MIINPNDPIPCGKKSIYKVDNLMQKCILHVKLGDMQKLVLSNKKYYILVSEKIECVDNKTFYVGLNIDSKQHELIENYKLADLKKYMKSLADKPEKLEEVISYIGDKILCP